jgi:hypothetical protein
MDVNLVINGTALIMGLILVPGLALSYGLLPKKIDLGERLGISLIMGLSPYLVFYFLSKNLNLAVTETNVLATLAGMTILGVVTYYARSLTASQVFKPTC